jgi:hypothetical protein
MYREWLRGWAIDDLATSEEIVADATNAGFVNAKVEDITPHVIKSVKRLYAMTVALFPGAYIGKLIKLRSEVLHRNIVSARLQWRARNRNLWISGIFSAQKPEAPAKPKDDAKKTAARKSEAAPKPTKDAAPKPKKAPAKPKPGAAFKVPAAPEEAETG